MNILFLSSQYLPHLGGVEVVVKNLAKEFVSNGHNVLVVTARAPRRLSPAEKIDGIPVRRFYLGLPDRISPSFFAFPVFFPLTIFRIVRLIRKKKIDILNLHFADKAGLYALCLSYVTKPRLVISLHGNDVEKFPEESIFYRQLFRLLVKRADLVTINSEFIRRKATGLAPRLRSKGRVLGNGVDLEEIEKAEPYQSDHPFILGLGRLVPKKGFDVLVNAFGNIAASFPNHQLIIAGDGPERSKLESLIEKLSLERKVTLLGRVTHEKALSLFKSCDLFVLPSRKEPFGIVLLEAMAAGAPIVATEVGGVTEIIKSGYNGLLVKSDNPDQLAVEINKVLSDESVRKKLSGHCLDFVDNFSWQQVAKRYIDLFAALAE